MGIEYKIKFEVKNRDQLKKWLVDIKSNYETYLSAELEEDGFYFCDYIINPELASHIFRKLIDKALSNSSEILIYEP